MINPSLPNASADALTVSSESATTPLRRNNERGEWITLRVKVSTWMFQERNMKYLLLKIKLVYWTRQTALPQCDCKPVSHELAKKKSFLNIAGQKCSYKTRMHHTTKRSIKQRNKNSLTLPKVTHFDTNQPFIKSS